MNPIKTHSPFVFCILFTCLSLNTACTTQPGQEPTITHPDAAWNRPELEPSSLEARPRIARSGKPRLEAKKIQDLPIPPTEAKPLSASSVLKPLPEEEAQKQDLKTAYTEASTPAKYSVKKGDNLWTIAKRHGVLLEDLLSYNGLQKDSVLKIGQVLLIPSLKSPLPSQNTTLASQETESYIVQPGDTLSALSLAAKVTVSDLKALNKLSKDALYIGQKLSLPKGTQEHLQRLKLNASLGQSKPKASEWPATTYIVKPGDTLSRIAQTQKVSMKVLMDLNDIQDPKTLRAGQKLKLPGDGAKTDNPPALAIPAAHPDEANAAISAPPSVTPFSDSLAPAAQSSLDNTLQPELSGSLPPMPASSLNSEKDSLNKVEDEAIFDDLTEAPVISLEEVNAH